MDGLRKAIAIDFDGCLCIDAFPAIGKPNWPVIKRAQMEQRAGAGLILWTCREGQILQDAIAACEGWGLTFDSINESLPDWIEAFGTQPRKVGASEYWDDKAVQLPVVPIDPLSPMKRLTSREPRSSGLPGVSCAHFRGGDCEAVQGRCSDGCPWEEAVWERLAAYEDTGLEPNEIVSVQEEPWCVFYFNRRCNLDGDFCPEGPGCPQEMSPEDALRLLKLAQAEKDGRLVVLPPNDPLTLRQLREMDGEPVWSARWGVWGLVDTGFAAVITRKGDLDINDEGIHERLYRRKPEEGTS